jgi:EmrB/QacA subfamily drug resistance transporter
MLTASADLGTRAKPHHRITFLVLVSAISSYALLQAFVIPVLATLRDDLHTSQSAVTWVVTSYLLSASVATPIMGRLGDIYGKKKLFVAALVLLCIGCLIAGLATSIGLMILARAIQGAGGGLLPLSFGILRDEFPTEKVGPAVASISTVTAFGSAIGVVLAGPINDKLGYHWLFWLPLFVCAITAVLTQLVVPESPQRSEGRISWLPAVLLSGCLVALLLGLSQAPSWGWLSGRVIALEVAAVLLGAAWIYSEMKARTPLIDMNMMRLRGVWTNNVVAALVGFCMYSGFAFLPEFMQMPTATGYGLGASIAVSGLVLLPSALCTFAAGQFNKPLTQRFGARALVIAGSLIASIGYALMAFWHDELWKIAVANLFNGAGMGFAFSAMSALIVEAVPAHQTGVASGMNANIRTIGGAVGSAIVGSVIASHLGSNGMPQEIGFTVAFAVLGVTCVLASVTGRLIPASYGHQALPEDEPAHIAVGLLPGGTVVGDKPE